MRLVVFMLVRFLKPQLLALYAQIFFAGGEGAAHDLLGAVRIFQVLGHVVHRERFLRGFIHRSRSQAVRVPR